MSARRQAPTSKSASSAHSDPAAQRAARVAEALLGLPEGPGVGTVPPRRPRAGDDSRAPARTLAQRLSTLPVEEAAALLDGLSTGDACRALFGEQGLLTDDRARRLLAGMRPERAAAVVEAVCAGIDGPREMARMMIGLDAEDRRGLLAAFSAGTLLQLLGSLAHDDQTELMRAAEAPAVARLLELLLGRENVVRSAWALELVRALDPEVQTAALGRLGERAREVLGRGAGLGTTAPLSPRGLRNMRVYAEEMSVQAGSDLLRRIYPPHAVHLLREVPAARAATLITVLAAEDRRLAADLLVAMNPQVLAAPLSPGIPPVWRLSECPAAHVVEALDMEGRWAQSLLWTVAADDLDLILEHVSPERQAEVAACLNRSGPTVLPSPGGAMTVGRGRRRSRRLGDAMRLVHIDEVLDAGGETKRVAIDLVELDLDAVDLVAGAVASDESGRSRREACLERAVRTGRPPSSSEVRGLGFLPLTEVVSAAGAVAGVRGCASLDDAVALHMAGLGLGAGELSGLGYGDPLGWCVVGGREVVPPALHRAAAVVTEDGRVHVERVVVTDLSLSNGERIEWEEIDRPKTDDRTIVYTPLFGVRTPVAATHVDLVVAAGRIVGLSWEGGVLIPPAGFVVAVPRDEAGTCLDRVGVGDRVVSGHNFPPGRGAVAQALGSGPFLVKDGAVALSFRAEGFDQLGRSDERLVPRPAAEAPSQSFLAVRGSVLVFGAAVGLPTHGAGAKARGMTHAELAQLCLDLGFDSAYSVGDGRPGALSVRGRDGVEPLGAYRRLPGEERPVATYWLAMPKSRAV